MNIGRGTQNVGKTANISTVYFTMIELERKFPSVEVLERIADALKIASTELF